MVLHLHRTLWEESGMSVKGLSLKGMWAAMVIMLIRGSRISNCVDTIADHAIKVESITIYYSTIALTTATYKGGDIWPEGLSMESAQRVDMLNDVSALDFDQQSYQVVKDSGKPIILNHSQGTPVICG